MKKKIILKVLSILFVMAWMILVFLLSNEVADDSSKTSGNTIRWILTLFNPDIAKEVLEQRIELLQPIVRKLAHFTLYTIGGILITIMFLQFKYNVKHIKIMSFLLGMMYAITDEIHQLFVPGRSGEIRDVIIDTAGVLLGVVVISFLVYIKGKLKLAKKKKGQSNKSKKVLFTATVDSHILHFHMPYLRMFKENGYEVHVATNGDETIPYCDKKHKISFERSPIKINNLKAIRQLKKIIDVEKFDIIHCHTPMGGVVTRLAAMNYRKNGTRVIYTAHGFHFYKGAPKLNWIIFYPIEKWLSRYTDTLITINEEDYELAKRKFHSRQIELVYGVGVDPEKFNFEMTDQKKEELRKEIGISKDDFVMIYPAELSKRKNQGMLLRCMAELVKENKNIKLLLPGLDSMSGMYQQMAKDLNIEENVKFLGYRTDIPKLLKISNLAVSAARQEGLPVNIMEAMVCGLPAVVTNCRGNRDLVENGVNGYIVEIDDDKELINKIIELINTRLESSFNDNYLISNVVNTMKRIYKIQTGAKRILHVVGSMNMGGAENFVMNLYRNIDRSKVVFDFLVHKDGVFDNEIHSLGGNVYKMKYVSKVGPFKYVRELKKLLTVHNDYEAIHSHVDQTSGIILQTAFECGITKRIAHSHSTSNSNNILVKLYKKYLQNKINKYSTLRLACSKNAGKWLYKTNNFKVINNGVDVTKFEYSEEKRKELRSKFNISEQDLVIGHVGRFSKVKNHDFLIDVFSEYIKKDKNTKLILLGDGELKENIQNKVNDLNLTNKVLFLGNKFDAYNYYSMFDLVLFPSLYEGISLVLIEAQINGLKIIASDKVDLKTSISGKIDFLELENKEKWINRIKKYDRFELSDKQIANYNMANISKEYIKLIREK